VPVLDRVERWLPALAGLLALFASVAVRFVGWDDAFTAQIDLQALIGVTFNVIAFATPVTVALFAITLAPGGGFIQQLFGTKTYALFVSYVIWALLLGVAALLVSAPFLVARPEAPISGALSNFAPIWWGVAAASLAAIGRVLLIFLVWARSYSKPKRVTERPALVAF